MNTYDKNERFNNFTKFKSEIMPYIPTTIKQFIETMGFEKLDKVEEIRLRAYKPLIVCNCGRDMFFDIKKCEFSFISQDPYIVKLEDVIRSFELISENSIYAFQEDIKNGFITLRGGHRAGICGRAVMDGNGVKNVRDISAINIRIAHQIKDCANKISGFVRSGNNSIFNTLIISPPQCGKTTIIRDLARLISNGNLENRGLKVSIIDERSEIAACYRGVVQNDVGVRTDVMDACPKSTGMQMMLRSMSPDVIITDEIGGPGDREAILSVVNAGVKIITTAHGYNITELKSRKEVLDIMEASVFDRYIVLSRKDGPGTLEEITDATGKNVIFRRLACG